MDKKNRAENREPGGLSNRRPASVRWPAAIAFAGFLAMHVQPAFADSAAARNREGNRLYGQQKYAEAEKEYLAARAEDPERPEVLYNLGNALIRQNKHREGIRTLEQSIRRGNDQIKKKAWYNAGNAHALAGDYKSAADAFIEALKIDSADMDAKHNLEIALEKLEAEQKKNPGNTQPGAKDQAAGKSPENRSDSQEHAADARRGRGMQKQTEETKPQANNSRAAEGSLSKEKALQLLQAIQNQEIDEQRKQLRQRAVEKSGARDW